MGFGAASGAFGGCLCLSGTDFHRRGVCGRGRGAELVPAGRGPRRGAIYDRDLSPLVGGQTQYVAAVAPTIQPSAPWNRPPAASTGASCLGPGNGRPFQLILEEPVEDPRIDVFQVPQRYREDQLAPHLIGYLDSTGGGAAGIELAMDDVLRQYEGKISVTYRVDAVGRAIAGEERQVVDTMEEAVGGVALTLDEEIQRLVQREAQKLGRGAVVVTEVPGCEIRALASVPDFPRWTWALWRKRALPW